MDNGLESKIESDAKSFSWIVYKEMASQVPGSARFDRGEGPIWRSSLPVGPATTLDGSRTLFEVFEASALRYPGNACLGHREIDENMNAGDFVWKSYGQVFEEALCFGSGLVNLDLCPPNSDGLTELAFTGVNRPEWVIGDIGCYSQRIVPVPMYDTLGADSMAYICDLTEVRTVLCTSREMGRVNELASKGTVTSAILMNSGSLLEEDLARIKSECTSVKVFSMQDIIDSGKNQSQPRNLPSANDVAFFCFTSGTTGNPKGALIQHKGILSCLASFRHNGVDISPEDVHLSYLPLPHVFERGVLYSVIFGGGRIGFSQGDVLKLAEDIAACRPTIFPSVPRLLNRFHDKLLAGVTEAGGLKQWLFESALASKMANLEQGYFTHALYDRLVFNGVKNRLGFDRLRLMITGSAPISADVLNFFRAVLGVPVIEGFGQTESSLLISIGDPGDTTAGHVGFPATCCEVRLVAVDDMGYSPRDTEHSDGTKCIGRGEILFRGPNVFLEYYKMPEKTAETIDQDGWCHTGDIGLFTLDGKLRIVDRKKNIFKLAQGEYVSAEKIQAVITTGSPLIMQAFVFGDSLQSTLVAIVVPDGEVLQSRNMDPKSPETKEAIFQSMVKACKDAKLAGFEIPKAIHVCEHEFNQLPERNGTDTILTPTFKLQRNKAREYFQQEIGSMYREINAKAKL